MANQINYSQSWEDPLILDKALKINKKDSILSISSSGDNTLYLLSKNPKKIVSVDINPHQNYLLELKKFAIKYLAHKEFLSFIGITESKNRILMYNSIKNNLSKNALDYWENNLDKIKEGVIHCGKFEEYLKIFRRFILPISQSPKRIEEFISCSSIQEQNEFYHKKWDKLLWRLTFRVYFSGAILKKVRDESLFQYNEKKSLSKHYLAKTKKGFTKVPIKKNYFLRYILKGSNTIDNLPDYINEENFNKNKKVNSRSNCHRKC